MTPSIRLTDGLTNTGVAGCVIELRQLAVSRKCGSRRGAEQQEIDRPSGRCTPDEGLYYRGFQRQYDREDRRKEMIRGRRRSTSNGSNWSQMLARFRTPNGRARVFVRLSPGWVAIYARKFHRSQSGLTGAEGRIRRASGTRLPQRSRLLPDRLRGTGLHATQN